MKIFGIRSGRAKCYFRTAQIIVRALLIVKQGLDFEQKSVLCDPNGRFIILEAVVQDTPFLFVNIYTPNKIHEQEAFFQKIERNLDSYDFDPNSEIVIGGDFNIFLTKI